MELEVNQQIQQADESGRTPLVFVHGGVTEIVEMPDRGHALVIDHGWREVADEALEFIRRFT